MLSARVQLLIILLLFIKLMEPNAMKLKKYMIVVPLTTSP